MLNRHRDLCNVGGLSHFLRATLLHKNRASAYGPATMINQGNDLFVFKELKYQSLHAAAPRKFTEARVVSLAGNRVLIDLSQRFFCVSFRQRLC